MTTIAVANAKGGTGKTSLSVHLATGLAARGKRTLLVDLDPQANASAWLLGPMPHGTRGAAEAMLRDGAPVDEIHAAPEREGLHVMPATPALSTVDIALAAEIGGDTALRRTLADLPYDFVILDCPPSLNLTVLNALCASDAVVAPVLPAFLTLTGLRKLEDTLARIRERLHVGTYVLGYVLFAADGRESVTADARQALRQSAGAKLYESEIRVSAAGKALPAHRKTAWDTGADPRGAADYAAVLEETLARLNNEAPRRAVGGV